MVEFMLITKHGRTLNLCRLLLAIAPENAVSTSFHPSPTRHGPLFLPYQVAPY